MKNTEDPKHIAVIPARMGSSRFPGKVLAEINGRPMLQYIIEACMDAGSFHNIYVATCDSVIYEFAKRCGVTGIMTSDQHERASDRVAEAIDILETKGCAKIETVTLVQGDEPMITGPMIDQITKALIDDPSIMVVNGTSQISQTSDWEDPNCIKVVVNVKGDAMYMSRLPIPSTEHGVKPAGGVFKQVCVIGFRREGLALFNKLKQTELEKAESIDMLRFIQNGVPVRMVAVREDTYPVDTPSDLERVSQLMR